MFSRKSGTATLERQGISESQLSPEEANARLVLRELTHKEDLPDHEAAYALDVLTWASGPEGLGVSGLRQYFGVEKNSDFSRNFGLYSQEDRPTDARLFAQIAIIHDKVLGMKRSKPLDGVQGKLVPIPNKALRDNVVLPLQQVSEKRKECIRSDRGPFNGRWIVIDPVANEVLSGYKDVSYKAPGTIGKQKPKPDVVYDNLEASNPRLGGMGSYELQYVIASPLHYVTVRDHLKDNAVDIRTVFAALLDQDLLHMMGREKDGSVHRAFSNRDGHLMELGFNLCRDTDHINFSMWDLRKGDNLNKMLAALGASKEMSRLPRNAKSIGKVAVGASSRK